MLRVPPGGYQDNPPIGLSTAPRSIPVPAIIWIFLLSLSAPLLARGQAGVGLDLALASKHVWRGQTYVDGWVLQPGIFAFRKWPRTTLTAGAWVHVEPFAPDDDGVGYGRTFGGEVNPWLDLGWKAGPLHVNAGLVGLYPRVGDAVGPASLRVRSHELYVQAVLSRPRLTPTVSVSYDFDAVEGAYMDVGLQYRLPVWTQVIVPVGSLFLRASAVLALEQSTNGEGSDRVGRYFADNGLTHVILSAWMPIGPFAIGATSNSLALAVNVQINTDRYLEDISAVVDASRRSKVWLGLTWSMLAPRCRASRGVCPVGSLP